MLTKKKRITKKEIKQDKLVTTYYQVMNYYKEYQAKFLIVFAALALVVIAVILLSNKRSNDNLAAASQLAKIMPVYEAGSFQEAIDGQPNANVVGLKQIVDNFGNTEQGEIAKIYLANSYIVLNKLEEAFQLYDDYSGSNPLLKATSLAGKASYYETKKEYEKAVDLYKDAARVSISNPSTPDYLLRAGINLLRIGKKEDAKSIFEEIKKEFTSSMAAQEIDRYLFQTES